MDQSATEPEVDFRRFDLASEPEGPTADIHRGLLSGALRYPEDYDTPRAFQRAVKRGRVVIPFTHGHSPGILLCAHFMSDGRFRLGVSIFPDWLPPSKFPFRPDFESMLARLYDVLAENPEAIFHSPDFHPVPKDLCDLMLRVEYGHLPPRAFWAVAYPDIVTESHAEKSETCH